MAFLSKSKVTEKSISKSFEICRSFNKLTTLDENTKYIIVGTLTTYKARNIKNKNIGYFYCTSLSRQYEFIDKAMNTNFEELKQNLIKKPTQENLNILMDNLREKNIAFLDVIDEAIAAIAYASDNSILKYSLDYDSFKKVDFTKVKNNQLKIIVNGKNSKVRLEEIFKKIGHEDLINKIIYIPQQLLAVWMTEDEIIDKWKEALK